MKRLKFLLTVLILVLLVPQGCSEDEEDDKSSFSYLKFTMDGQENVWKNVAPVNVYSSSIQLVGNKTAEGEEISFELMVNASETGSYNETDIVFTCGKDIAYCADEISANFGAEFSIELTETDPGLKGRFSGIAVQCGLGDSTTVEIKDGEMNIRNEDIMRY